MVGYDGEVGGREALALGCRMAADLGTDVLAVNVRRHVERGPKRPAVVDLMVHMEVLDAAAGVSHDVEVDTVVVEAAEPAEALGEVAARRSADVLVVGTSRRRAGRDLPTGVVDPEIVNGACCRVAVAPLGFSGRPEQLELVTILEGASARAGREWGGGELDELPALPTFPG